MLHKQNFYLYLFGGNLEKLVHNHEMSKVSISKHKEKNFSNLESAISM